VVAEFNPKATHQELIPLAQTKPAGTGPPSPVVDPVVEVEVVPLVVEVEPPV